MPDRTCKRCGETKPLSAFRERTRVLPTRVDRWHVTACRTCEAVITRERPIELKRTACRESRARNPGATKEANTRSNVSRDPEHRRQWSSNNYAKNRERILRLQKERRDPEKENARQRDRYAKDPTNAKLAYAKRRARLSNVDSPLTKEQWLRIVEAYDGRCAYCGDIYKVIEHVIPLSRGGKNEVGNVVPACEPCNNHKARMTPQEWIGPTPSGSPPLLLTG